MFTNINIFFILTFAGFTTDLAPSSFQKSRSSVESVDSTILYVASAGKNALDKNYRIVATVENFFEIIYNVHVELGGRNGRHAGQKRTYRIVRN